MEEKNILKYTKDNLNEFRKSIQAMGTTVKNGTVEIPMSSDILTKGRRAIAPIKPEDILKTPMNDIRTWRKYSRVYFANHYIVEF